MLVPTIKVNRADKIIVYGPSAVRVEPAEFADVNSLVVTPKLVGSFEVVALGVYCENGSIREHNGCAAINVVVAGR